MKISILEIVLYSIMGVSVILYAIFAIKDARKLKKEKERKQKGIEIEEKD